MLSLFLTLAPSQSTDEEEEVFKAAPEDMATNETVSALDEPD